MFPDAQHTPSRAPQCANRFSISTPVPFNLLTPVLLVVRRHPQVLGTPMPKASIHENSNAPVWKHKVGFARQRPASSPSDNAMFPKNLNELQFGRFISM
jgi:hypothetical protein